MLLAYVADVGLGIVGDEPRLVRRDGTTSFALLRLGRRGLDQGGDGGDGGGIGGSTVRAGMEGEILVKICRKVWMWLTNRSGRGIRLSGGTASIMSWASWAL